MVPVIVAGPVADNENAEAAAAPPSSFVTVLTSVSFGAISLLLMVQVAFWPSASVRFEPESVPAEQAQALAVYPGTVASDSAYEPEFTEAPVTAALPVTPEIVVGPVAVRKTVLAANVPPSSLVTVFTNVSVGEISLSLMVQLADCPSANTKLLPVNVPAEQLQAPAV